MKKVEKIDEQIARLLGQDGQQSSETLAKKLNISAATVRRRLRKLIQADSLRIVGVVDPSEFGFPLNVVISIDISYNKIEPAMLWLVNQPEVAWVSTATGKSDIILRARFRSIDSLYQFLTKKMSQLDGLKDSETFICLDVRKGRHVPFIVE